MDFTEAPLSKVVAAVSRQGGVQIVTNADLSMPVTLQLRRAPLFEALDTLAVRIDGDMRLTYLLAPDRAKLAEAANGFAASNRITGWKVFSSGGGGTMVGETAPDLRRVSFTPSAMEDSSLHALLNQAAQKTGVSFAAPEDWNPSIARLPKPASASASASNIAKAAKGRLREIVLISVRSPRGEEGERAERREGEGGGVMGGGGGRGNPEWMAERAQAQIKLLPPEERAQAQADFDEMRGFFDSLRGLPPEERRAKMEEFFERPDVQERLEERAMNRDMKRSPKQRAQRFKRYLDRKEQAQARAQGAAR